MFCLLLSYADVRRLKVSIVMRIDVIAIVYTFAYTHVNQWAKSPKKNSLMECVFVNSALEIQCHCVSQKYSYRVVFGDFADWVAFFQCKLILLIFHCSRKWLTPNLFQTQNPVFHGREIYTAVKTLGKGWSKWRKSLKNSAFLLTQHSKYSAMSKIHSYRLLIQRFCPLECWWFSSTQVKKDPLHYLQ